MDNRTKAVVNHIGEVVFVGTHRECNRWLLNTYPGVFRRRIKKGVYDVVLPGVFRIQLVKGEETNG